MSNLDTFINIDVIQLFITLLTVALLQEFAIKPSVEFLHKYYHKAKKHLGDQIK